MRSRSSKTEDAYAARWHERVDAFSATGTTTSRLFRRGELWTLCVASLKAHGPQDTRELSRGVAEAKAMDASDPALCKALAYRIVQALTLQWKRGKLGSEGIRKSVRVWALLKA